MSKLIIIDGKTKYEIKTAQDLYDLYNEWAMDTPEEDTYNYEIVNRIRDHYQFIFDNIKKQKYDLADFESAAFDLL